MIKTLALAALLASSTLGSVAAAATLVQNGSFEQAPAPDAKGIKNGVFFGDLTTSPVQSWDIYGALPGWTAISGAGIEIQTDRTVPEIDADFGEHYAELDSNNNSAMRQALSLNVGRYLLSFWYSPRALLGGTSAETNGIAYSIANLAGSVNGPGAPFGTTVGDWTEVTGTFHVGAKGVYNLDFAAVGTSSTYGGFIDNVSVAPVPVPAAGLLMAGALGGLAALRRRRIAG